MAALRGGFNWSLQHIPRTCLPGFDIARSFGSFIELPCYRAKFGLAMQGQIGAAWKILAQQSVDVFV
jgi:hypothetical protein